MNDEQIMDENLKSEVVYSNQDVSRVQQNIVTPYIYSSTTVIGEQNENENSSIVNEIHEFENTEENLPNLEVENNLRSPVEVVARRKQRRRILKCFKKTEEGWRYTQSNRLRVVFIFTLLIFMIILIALFCGIFDYFFFLPLTDFIKYNNIVPKVFGIRMDGEGNYHFEWGYILAMFFDFVVICLLLFVSSNKVVDFSHVKKSICIKSSSFLSIYKSVKKEIGYHEIKDFVVYRRPNTVICVLNILEGEMEKEVPLCRHISLQVAKEVCGRFKAIVLEGLE